VRISSRIFINDNELTFSFARSGGPGGQNVNKLNTKAILKWGIRDSDALSFAVKERFEMRYGNRINESGEVVIASDRHRTQSQNKQDCLDRLTEMIRSVLTAPKKRKPTRPTRASKERRLKGKRQRSEKKQRRKPVRGDD
jgi:ribosome-associated protein